VNRPDWSHRGWWRWYASTKIIGVDLETKLDPNEFGGGRVGTWINTDEISQYMCSTMGCSRRAYASWAGCADDNVNRPLCPEHDVQLNLLALHWWEAPQWHEKMTDYQEKVERDIGRKLESWCYDPDSLYRQMMEKMHQREDLTVDQDHTS